MLFSPLLKQDLLSTGDTFLVGYDVVDVGGYYTPSHPHIIDIR